MNKEQKQGFLKRSGKGVVRYVGRRFGNSFINEVGVETLKESASRARHAIIPRKFDADEFRSGMNGRYEDGGISRFSEMMIENNLKDEDIPALRRQYTRSAGVMFISAAAFLMIGAYMMFVSDIFIQTVCGFITSFVSFLFIALGLRHDFSRWQVENRRFGGFSEYLFGEKRKRPTL